VESRKGFEIQSFHSAIQTLHLVRKIHVESYNTCASLMITAIWSSKDNQRVCVLMENTDLEDEPGMESRLPTAEIRDL